jgi:hypothetical protein
VPKRTIPSRWLVAYNNNDALAPAAAALTPTNTEVKPTNTEVNGVVYTNKEVGRWSSLIGIPDCMAYNEREKEGEWAGWDLNPRSPPCQGGILTRLDHRPNIQ